MHYFYVWVEGEHRKTDAKNLRETFDTDDVDYSGVQTTFHVKNWREIEPFRKLLEGMVEPSTSVHIEEIAEKDWDWRAHQRRR